MDVAYTVPQSTRRVRGRSRAACRHSEQRGGGCRPASAARADLRRERVPVVHLHTRSLLLDAGIVCRECSLSIGHTCFEVSRSRADWVP
jgi:hypothetical protein